MREQSVGLLQVGGPQPRTIGLIVVLVLLCLMLWGTFVIVPTGSRGSFSGGAASKSVS
jgi:hypothetical protein